ATSKVSSLPEPARAAGDALHNSYASLYYGRLQPRTLMAQDTAAQQQSIDSILQETRSFPPPPEFSRQAHIKTVEDYERLYAEAERDPEAFWGKIARELHWFQPWQKVLEWKPPWAEWFVGAQIN